ncbi:hypothetical protein M9H77_20386 [Catharanthus roseus]|uniref:Uncharacterized protein n=1 Tax=Catharanthus roseus TaxID=4058 RepID=A0ACC0AJG5_CATRO|nr:hypothetical protein M9H77_20386 [Catharanthus roseus]
MATSSTEIVHDFFPLIRVYKDGRIERMRDRQIAPASVDQETGVKSKDVEISKEFNVSARLYLPNNSKPGEKLPLLVYFHGGAFVIESAFSPEYQKHLNLLVNEANVMIVSVDYRLAPEFPLPCAYEDSWLALQWIASHSIGEGSDQWLKDYADFNRVYFGGDSAGGNIAHNMAIKVEMEKLEGINLLGFFLNCPYFWGKDPIGDEMVKTDIKKFLDNLWLFLHPNTTGLNDPLINPVVDPNLYKLEGKKVLIFVAEKDILKHRGLYYKEALEKIGNVEFVEFEGEEHVFNLASPQCENALLMVKKLAVFLNQNGDKL